MGDRSCEAPELGAALARPAGAREPAASSPGRRGGVATLPPSRGRGKRRPRKPGLGGGNGEAASPLGFSGARPRRCGPARATGGPRGGSGGRSRQPPAARRAVPSPAGGEARRVPGLRPPRPASAGKLFVPQGPEQPRDAPRTPLGAGRPRSARGHAGGGARGRRGSVGGGGGSSVSRCTRPNSPVSAG